MNRSYSKIRNINSVNYLLEQKYLEDKRNTDRGVLVEQPTTSIWFDEQQDNVRGINYGQFNSCTSGLGRVGGARIRFDGNFYYFSDGKYTYKNNFDQYKKDIQNNPEAEMKYSGTYSCKETKDVTTNTTKSIIKRVEDNPTTTTTTQASNIQQSGRPLKSDSNSDSSSQTSNTNTTTSGGDFGEVLYNVFTPNDLSTIRTKIGSGETSPTLTQTDINLLYTAIENA
jgi:hypothetical protein